MGALVLGMMICSCSGSQPDIDGISTATRPAYKQTCAEATLVSDLDALDRRLVPYGPTLLGVDAVWGDDERRFRVISGGYLDDVFEAYDELEEIGRTEIRGSEATLLASSLLGEPVRAAVWYEKEETPCDVHAVIATGLDDEEFERQLRAVR